MKCRRCEDFAWRFITDAVPPRAMKNEDIEKYKIFCWECLGNSDTGLEQIMKAPKEVRDYFAKCKHSWIFEERYNTYAAYACNECGLTCREEGLPIHGDTEEDEDIQNSKYLT